MSGPLADVMFLAGGMTLIATGPHPPASRQKRREQQ